MKIYNYILAFIFILPALQGISQKNVSIIFTDSETLGDKYKQEQRYKMALEEYSKSLFVGIGQENLKLKMVDCYRALGDMENTAKYLEMVLDRGADVEPRYFLYYAEALNALGHPEKAISWYQIYSLNTMDMQGNNKVDAIENRQAYFFNEKITQVKEVWFNSTQSEFAPFILNDLVYLVSNRPSNKGILPRNSRDGNFYFDIFKVENNRVTPLPKSINSMYHEGPFTFNSEGNEMIFTRSAKQKSNIDGETKLQLFSTTFQADKNTWTPPLPLNLNSTEYSVAHPTLSETGTTLYFVSDMPGGFGGTDIYKVEIRDNIWGEPENLGYEINTEGDELFPFLHKNGKLYFSSNGHPGLGGLDLFVVDLNSKPYRVVNLGSPVNSSGDDFSIAVDESGDFGYFSTNRADFENDDIFEVKGLSKIQ